MHKNKKSTVKAASKQGKKTQGKEVRKEKIAPKVKKLATKEMKMDRADAVGNYFANSEGGKENIGVVINGSILSQFIVGVYSSIIGKSDNPVDYNNMLSLAYTVYNNWTQLGAFTIELPRPLACVWASLKSKTIGRFAYDVDFAPLNDNGLMYNAIFPPPGSSQANMINSLAGQNGLFTSVTNSVTILNANTFRTVQSNYASRLCLVPVEPLLSKFANDPSIFAWDAAVTNSNLSGNNSPSILSLAGGSLNGGYFFIRESSSVCLELPIKCRWMAQLRLCTAVDFQNSIQYSGYDIVRRPGMESNCTTAVNTLPAALGYQLTKRCAGGLYIPDSGPKSSCPPLQLKQIPSVGLGSTIIARLETMANVSGQANSWKTTWNAVDLQVFVAGLIRYAMLKSVFTSAGVVLANSTVTGALVAVNRISNNVYESINLPQSVQDLLAAIRPYYDDKEGDIYPVMSDFDPNQMNYGFLYTGTSSYPKQSINPQTKYNVYNTSYLVQQWKQFELSFASVTSLVPMTKANRTCMDISLQQNINTLVSDNGFIVNSATSRRPISDNVLKVIYSRMGAIGYESGASLNFTPGSQGGLGDHIATKRQPYVYRMAGIDNKNTLITLSITDGLVLPGTEARQNPTVNGNAAPAQALNVPTVDLPKPVDLGSYRGWGYKAMEALGSYATYGNYGGPGWTAGTRDVSKMDMVGGKYVKAPVDPEDALYKRHDEAIHHAGPDAVKQQLADKELAEGLSKLPSRSKFGDLAYYFFSK